MPVYNFKKLHPIPSATDFVDIVLTRTQRRTPTVVHPGYKITRIRQFYMRKIKFTQQTIVERLSQILNDFPRLNDIHPFYSDLCNILYDRDHYKLALGQLNTARSLVEAIGRDMIRMIKYADSLYRAKSLKRAALGRMCTVLKRQKASFAYLEEVRKHLSRLPALDPNERTILMCGLPNVGKSSFMNKITRADVDVQPYAFTTKSLFVGHTDHRYLRWQVIDTPGILDHPLEQRNTIEMQAITALAHLTCTVLYFIDISEQCGFPISQQVSLFRSIKPLFANKQLLIVVNKVDQQPWDTLDPDQKRTIEELANEANCSLMTMSNLSEEGVSDVKNAACDKLLASRVDARINGKKVESVMNRLQVFYPPNRDNVERDVCVPDSVVRARDDGTLKPKRSRLGYAPTKADEKDEDTPMDHKKTARDLMWENGGPGVWAPDYREQYDLEDDEWRFDAIPEIIDGKNIADYIDPDIEKKLAALEKEEEQIMAELDAVPADDDSDLDSEEEAAVYAIRERKGLAKLSSRISRSQNKSVMPREIRGRMKDVHDTGKLNPEAIKKHLDGYGVDSSKMIERGRDRGRKRERSMDRRREERAKSREGETDVNDRKDVEMQNVDDKSMSKKELKKVKRERSISRKRENSLARSHSRPREAKDMGLRDEIDIKAVKKKNKAGQLNWHGASGEGDNTKMVTKIKWCNTGKKRSGTSYQR